jgi:very-short-patch-repair endonuclease
VDGEYWHPKGNETDKMKDEIAIKHGYKTLRISPKNNITK